jgi:hypothetical protein
MTYERIVARGRLRVCEIDGNFSASILESVAVLATHTGPTWTGVVIECAYDAQFALKGADVLFSLGSVSGRGIVVRTRPLEIHSAGRVRGLPTDVSQLNFGTLI